MHENQRYFGVTFKSAKYSQVNNINSKKGQKKSCTKSNRIKLNKGTKENHQSSEKKYKGSEKTAKLSKKKKGRIDCKKENSFYSKRYKKMITTK